MTAYVRFLPFALGLSVPASVQADVDPDCRSKQALLCDAARLADAEAVDAVVAPIVNQAGWSRPCLTVMYVAGEAGGADAISITLHGPKGLDAPACLASSARAKKTLLYRIGAQAKKTLRAHHELTVNVDTLQVTDGMDGDIRLHLP
jgi:hypothetical protein